MSSIAIPDPALSTMEYYVEYDSEAESLVSDGEEGDAQKLRNPHISTAGPHRRGRGVVFGTLEEKLCSRIHFFESVTFLEEILLKSYYFRSRFFEKKVIFFRK